MALLVLSRPTLSFLSTGASSGWHRRAGHLPGDGGRADPSPRQACAHILYHFCRYPQGPRQREESDLLAYEYICHLPTVCWS
ncbi:hypothetical protein BRADI_5g10666v3 [Brachypodium distachyon]|uniref:Uncharacterized protein n=1 Tax=Brachypodium distachyon TaxID=15368 RepID=A0A0Q3H3J1_BRADI|nr:hypothetical protein BRADI_5g10666v3 [Brachypodium distachyon]